jgi:hypothetical protein
MEPELFRAFIQVIKDDNERIESANRNRRLR